MQSFKQYLITEGGQSAERQETGFVNAVNDAVFNNDSKPIDVITGDATIKGVIKAEKYSGRQASGSEPYTDVRLFTASGILNLSMKGPSAPSLAGGGLRGVEAILPGITMRFFRAAFDNHKKRGLKPGDKVPDTFAKLNDKDKMLLVVGNETMGGPIHYMYIGPMDVKFSVKGNKLSVNGKLIQAQKYAKSKDLYFRLRARRHDQTFDPTATDKNNIPKIYGVSPSKKDSAGRLVITDKPSKARGVITF